MMKDKYNDIDPYQHPEDEDRDGLRNVGLFTLEPLDPADSQRELHYTQSTDLKAEGTGSL
jgi:hypothetical protein